MTEISPQLYDSFERTALRTMPNLAQMAFSPATFLQLNIPVTVTEESELLRFVDSMHETSWPEYLAPSFSVTPDEAGLLQRVADHVEDFTGRAWGKRLRPWTAPLSALEMFRVVTALAERVGKKQVTVLEIGPGSGYLGSMLHLAGHRHIAMDNTQAFYVWQNRMWSDLAGDKGMLELADPAIPLVDDPTQAFVHIPWWRFIELHRDNPFKVDFVICDHALNEITTIALRYILHRAHAMLGQDGMVLFCYPGHGQMRDETGLFREFRNAGFDPLFKRLFYAFAPRGGQFADMAIPHDAMGSAPAWKRALVKLQRKWGPAHRRALLSLDDAIPAFDPPGGGRRLAVADVLPYRPDVMDEQYRFADGAGYRLPTP